MKIIAAFFLVFVTSFLLTWLVRQYSLRKSILDIPNERSSHTLPTPRGGGIAIALSFFIAIAWFTASGVIAIPLAKALLGGGMLIALTGYIDDLTSLPAFTRALLHFLAAGWACYCLGGFPLLDLGPWQIHLGGFGSVIATLGIVWLINLYNFMDGIDGISGSEALFVSFASALALYFLGAFDLVIVCLFLFFSVLGFIIWNWPPAKIFLGDAGSGLLGYVFAVLLLASANQHVLSPLFWLTLLAVFIFDATLTLVMRIARGERWYTAHREHIYQRLTQSGLSHKQVTLRILGINIFLLLPLSFFILWRPNFSLVVFLMIGFCFSAVWFCLVKLLPVKKN